MFGNEQVVPLRLETPHHGRVNCWGIAWPKGHDAERVFLIVGSKEGELFLIAGVHGDLMVSLPVIEAHHEERAMGVAPFFSIASSHRGIGYSNGRVTKLGLR